MMSVCFLHLDWLEGACIVLRLFFFLPHTSLLFSFPFPLSFPFFYLPPTLVIYISWLQSWQEQFDFIWRALVNRVYISFLGRFGS